MFSCDVGDVVYIQNVFTNSAGGTVDPSEVILYLAPPTGAVGTYKYSAAEVTRQSQGTYYYNGTATMPGNWNARWVGTGAAVAAAQSRYFVRETNT
jgi:hypothetical protein